MFKAQLEYKEAILYESAPLRISPTAFIQSLFHKNGKRKLAQYDVKSLTWKDKTLTEGEILFVTVM